MRLHGPAVLAAGVLAAAIALAGCSGGEQKAGGRHKLDLEIGDLVPLSGTEQPFGAPGQKAVNLAVGEIRKAITKAKVDHTVTVSHQNYRSEPKLAQDLAGRLQRAGTTCFVGPWSTGALIPVANTIAIPKKVLEITPAASSDATSRLGIGGYINRTIPPDHVQAQALATQIATELGGAKGKKVSVGAIRNIYGTTLANTFSTEWKKRGGTISANVIYEQNLPDYRKQAQELVAPKPDAYAFFDVQDNYTRVATELLKTGKWKASRAFATDTLAVANLGESGGATVDGLRGVAPSWPRFGANAKAFLKLWVGGPPPRYRQPYDPQAFDATVLCYLSAVAAGSTKGSSMKEWVRRISSPPGKKLTWRQLPAAIAALQAGEDIDYEGASGPLDLNNLGNPTAGFYDAYRYTDARLSLYGSVAVPPSSKGIETFRPKFVTPKIPGATPAPAGAIGATGATGATGAAGQNGKGGAAKKKQRSRK